MRAWLLFAGLLGCGRIGFDPHGDAVSGDLEVSPTSAAVNLSSVVTLVATGGAPPYAFAVTAGEGEIDGAGRYFAPGYESAGEVTVTDAEGVARSVAIEHRGAKLFVAGGLGANGKVMASDDGAAWTEVGTLPDELSFGDLTVFDDRLWYFGGEDASKKTHEEVWVSTDGATWTLAGHLESAASVVAVAVFQQELWALGGFVMSGLDLATVNRSTDGASWTAGPALPVAQHAARAVVLGGTLHVFGGHSESDGYLDTAHTIDGGAWTLEPGRLATSGDDRASARLGDDIYTAAASDARLVERTRDFVTWSAVGNLPTPRNGAALVGFRGQLIMVGGGTTVLRSANGATWSSIGTLNGVAGGRIVQFTPR